MDSAGVEIVDNSAGSFLLEPADVMCRGAEHDLENWTPVFAKDHV
jgi:hypothetical protein